MRSARCVPLAQFQLVEPKLTPLAQVLELYDRSVEPACRKTPDVNEARLSFSLDLLGALIDLSTLAQVVLGTLKKLPGCNPLTKTTRAAQAASRTCPNVALPPVFKTTTTYTSKFAPPGSLVTKECVLLSSSIDLLERELNLDSALQHALHRRDLQGLQVRPVSLSPRRVHH